MNKIVKTYKVKISGLTDVLNRINEQNIRTIFSPFGEIESVEVPKDPMSGQNFGYAYVVYSKKKDAKAAIEEMDGTEIKGKVISVNFVDDEEEEEALH